MASTIATQYDIGIRQTFVGLGERNFDTTGTTQYKAAIENLYFDGSYYDIGDSLPFDVGGTHYSTPLISVLQDYWNQNWLTPSS